LQALRLRERGARLRSVAAALDLSLTTVRDAEERAVRKIHRASAAAQTAPENRP
jgi:hypothetical protein